MNELCPTQVDLARETTDNDRRSRIVFFGSVGCLTSLYAAKYQQEVSERGITDLVVHCSADVTSITDTFFGRTAGDPSAESSLPGAIVVFPSMRQHGPGPGMTVPAQEYLGTLNTLCLEHNVPQLYLKHEGGPDDAAFFEAMHEVEAAMRGAFPAPEQLAQLPSDK